MTSITWIDCLMIVFGLLTLLVWLFFYKKGLAYNSMFEVLEEKEYPLKEIYGLGFAFLEAIKYSYKSKSDRKLRQELEVLYGEKYSDYYLRVVHSQQITLAFTLFVFSFIFYGLTQEILAFFVLVMFAGLAYYYYGTIATKKIQSRSEELLHDFSEVVSKLALMTNAGMILREAWTEISYGGTSLIYQEMKKSVDDMNNGMSDSDAIYLFGTRCLIPEIKKFTSTIVQGLNKGNKELAYMLQEQSKEVWQLKKQLVRREGEKASSKLLIPICIMFIGILLMIIVPVFTNLGIA